MSGNISKESLDSDSKDDIVAENASTEEITLDTPLDEPVSDLTELVVEDDKGSVIKYNHKHEEADTYVEVPVETAMEYLEDGLAGKDPSVIKRCLTPN